MQLDQLRRREVITLLGGAAAWPMGVRAQQPTVGFLSGRSADESDYLIAAFRRGIGEIGFVEGRNVSVVYRWADGDLSRVPALAADLTGLGVRAFVAVGGSELALSRIEKSVPIVFNSGPDPVKAGLVSSLNRPSGNATGVWAFYYDLEPKRLQILREFPSVTVVAALMRPNAPNADQRANELHAAAEGLGLRLQILRADSTQEIDAAFGEIRTMRADAVLVAADPFFNSRREQLVQLAAHQALPALFHSRELALAGGLMSYGGNIAEAYQLVGQYVGRLLKGAAVAELPVQLATKVELIINLKTAKALGLTVPDTLLARVDEVIE